MSNLKHIVSFLFVMFVFVSSCTSSTEQANKTLKDSTMMTTEKFVFEEWEIRLENRTTNYKKDDGTKVIMSGIGEPFISEILPPPSFLKKQRLYYKNGSLGMVGYFISELPIGLWKYYDKKGFLIKEIDEDKKFGEIKPKDILLFLDKEGYINAKTGEGRFDQDGREIFTLGFRSSQKSTLVGEKDNPPTWYITIEPSFHNKYMQTDYILDGNTGEVLNKKTEQILPIE